MTSKRATRVVIAMMIAVAGVLTTGGGAFAAIPRSIDSPSPASDQTQYVGSGKVDVSQLTIVGIIDPATGTETDVTPFHPSPNPAETSTDARIVSPLITHPACQGRVDFYRLIDTYGNQQCFANSGTYTLTSGYWVNTQYLCPGNNEGRTEYLNGTTNTWSVWRGPVLVYSTCYEFAYPVPAFAVQIA